MSPSRTLGRIFIPANSVSSQSESWIGIMTSGFYMWISSTQWISVSSISNAIVFLNFVGGRSTIKPSSSSTGGAVTPHIFMLTRLFIVWAKCLLWSYGVSDPSTSSTASSVSPSPVYSCSIEDTMSGSSPMTIWSSPSSISLSSKSSSN